MIDAAKRFYLERKGHEGWIEILETALADARIEFAEAERIKRQTPPDYDRITPHDHIERIKTEFGV